MKAQTWSGSCNQAKDLQQQACPSKYTIRFALTFKGESPYLTSKIKFHIIFLSGPIST